MQKFYKGRTNNHLTWVMVDATDYASPESALSAATKIKIYGKLRGGTGTNFVSSGTGSLTNDITHVGASVLGIYTIALAKADLSDASAAWYDQYVISLSATGAAYQTLVVDGGIDDSNLSGVVSDLYSLLSDHHSDFQSRVPKAVATNSQLSDLHSDLRSYLVVMSGVQSDLYSLASDLQSDFQSRVPKRVATDSQLSDMASDLKSAIAAGPAATITASDISNIASAVWNEHYAVNGNASSFGSAFRIATSRISDIQSYLAVMSGVQSDVYSLLSDHHSDFQSRVPKRVATDSQLSDLASDIRSLMSTTGPTISDIASAVILELGGDMSDIRSAIAAGPAATITASDISNIASAVWNEHYAANGNASSFGSAFRIATSRVSDIQSYLAVMSGVQSDVYSLLSDHHSDFQSRVPKAVATNSQLSDLHSDLKSYLAVMSGVQSDIYSLASDLQSDFQSRVPKRVATDSQLSDLASDIKSAVVLAPVNALNVDTYAEPAQGTPGATVTLATKIGFLYKAWRNKTTQTATQYSLLNDDAVTVDHKASVSDDGTTFSKGEVATGP